MRDRGTSAIFSPLYASSPNPKVSSSRQTEKPLFPSSSASTSHPHYSWIIAADPRSQRGLVLHLIEIANPLQRIPLATRLLLLLLFLLQRLHRIILPRSRCFVLLLPLYELIEEGLLIGICNLQLLLLRPLVLILIPPRPRGLLVHPRLIVEEVTAFGDMLSALLPLLYGGRSPLLDLLQGIEVFLLDVIPFDPA